MIPSGSTTPVGGNQNGTPTTLLRTNSGILGGQGVGGGPGQQQQHQQGFPSLLGSRNQYSNLNMLGGGGGANSGIQGFNNGGVSQPNNNVGVPPSLQRAMAMANDSLPLSSPLIRPGAGSQFANPSDQHDQQKFQHGQHQQGQDLISSFQLQSQGPGILGARNMQQFQNQLQPYRSLPNEQFRNLSAMKLDPQQLQSLRNLPVKMEQPQSHGDQSMLIQQQQLLQFPRQNPSQQMQIQAYLQHQQRLLQQQQIMQAFPQQRPQMQQQPLQQLQQQNSPVPMALKSPSYESGVCARRLTQYMCQQQRRPEDNNIEFWRKFVDDFFAPHAKKRWCVSQYGSGRQTTGVFPQDVWQCEICGTKPGKGFETTVEVLPRLCKIKYDSGTLEELLYVDMPREYPTPSGHIVLEYGKAIQESVFEQLRVVRDGQLRIVFSSDLKICSWEFCARSHEELIPRRLLIPQVSQLGAIAQKHQASVQNGSTTPPVQDLQSNFNMFVATARQLVKALEVPLVNDLGYTKRYVRCLQISEVVNSMKDLIDFSRENKIGPIASLNSFPRRTSTPVQNQGTPQQEQSVPQTAAGSEQGNGQPSATHINTNNNVNNPASTSSQANSPSVLAGIIHQNSVNNRQNGSSAFTNSVHAPSGSSVHVPQSQISPSSSVPNSGSSASNSMQASPASTLTSTSAQMPSISASTSLMQQPAVPPEDVDPNDQESSVHHLIQEMMMSSQMNGGSPFQASVGATNMGVNSAVGNDLKSLQGSVASNNGSSGLKGANGFGTNCLANNASMDFNNLGPIDSMPNPVNGMRHSMAITNNNVTLNGRAGVSSLQSLSLQDANLNLQQDLGGSRLLNGLGSAGNFNNLQFDWKSP